MNKCPFCGTRCKGEACQAHDDLRDSASVLDDRDTDPCPLCGWTVCDCPDEQ